MEKINRETLDKIAAQPRSTGSYIRVGMSTCGIAAGAKDVFELLSKETKQRDMKLEIRQCGCLGMCHAEPLVEVAIEGMPSVTYGRVSREVALRILEEHVGEKRFLNDHIFDMPVRR